ncbi:unnamed protein product [Schistosoma curassoni]|uniref:Uncharacterized protein n=1 Tax=Schistosoma curassoni TaxID=6186 RepID=A0A183KGD8_9TREM|nr:unnamed protein product [Schistosoma curassoni]
MMVGEVVVVEAVVLDVHVNSLYNCSYHTQMKVNMDLY